MEMATHPKAEILLNSDNQVTIHSLNDKHTYSLKDEMPMTPQGWVTRHSQLGLGQVRNFTSQIGSYFFQRNNQSLGKEDKNN